ncbi:hypothetical protein QTP88_009785 [Uroleucon formosanum]
MRRLRRQCFPATPRNLAELHYLLVADENKEYTQTLQSPPNRFYQGPLLIQGIIQGMIFCNLVNIQQIENGLRNICTAGCDGTFKTVPTFLNKDAAYQIFSFHILALPYLPATAINVIPSMEDGFHTIIEYINQFSELANMIPFLNNYILGYWFVTIGPAAVTCYNQKIRTNNYVESYHASLLKLIKPYPKIQNGVPTRARTNNTNTIRDFLQELTVDEEPNRILTFLR